MISGLSLYILFEASTSSFKETPTLDGVVGRRSSSDGALALSFAFGLELFSGSTGHRRGYSPLRVHQRQLFSYFLYLGESPYAPLLYPQDVVAFGRLFL